MLIDYILGHIKSTDKSIRGISHSCYSVFFISSFPLDSILEFPFLCSPYPICSYMLSSFFIRGFNLLIIDI